MSDESKYRGMDALMRVGIVVCLGVCSWVLLQSVDHEKRLAVIEDTRHTREDARRDREEIISSIQTPRWIEERFERIADQNERLLEQLEVIEDKMERLPSR